MIRLERYHARVNFEMLHIDADIALVGKAFDILPKPDFTFGPDYHLRRLELTFVGNAERKMTFTVDWEFDELFSDDRVSELGPDTVWMLSRRLKWFHLPNRENQYSSRSYCLIYLARQFVRDAIFHLSILSTPRVFTSFLDAPSTAEIECRGERFSVDRQIWSGQLAFRGRPITEASVGRAFSNRTKDHEALVFIADERMQAGDLRGAIVNLTTSMELAFYERERLMQPDAAPENFSPKGYLRENVAPGLRKWIELNKSMGTKTIDSLETLWGTRNEIVHNGKLKIRPASWKRNEDKSTFEDATLNHYYAFRTDLSVCFEWLGFAPLA